MRRAQIVGDFPPVFGEECRTRNGHASCLLIVARVQSLEDVEIKMAEPCVFGCEVIEAEQPCLRPEYTLDVFHEELPIRTIVIEVLGQRTHDEIELLARNGPTGVLFDL